MALPILMAAEKRIVSFPGWSEPEAETDYLWFNAPVDVEGVTDFVLHGGCYANLADQHVSFELRGFVPGVAKRKPLARVDWRPVTGGHTCRRRKGVPDSGRRIEDSHIHPFEKNWVQSEGRMRAGNLNQADEIPEDIQSFESLRTWVGIRLQINNIDIVSRPPWAYTLFPNHG